MFFAVINIFNKEIWSKFVTRWCIVARVEISKLFKFHYSKVPVVPKIVVIYILFENLPNNSGLI